jgi:hypothetical protein
MKVGIIGFANLRYMPYIKYYTAIFDKYEVEYEIIYWNRRGLDEEWHAKTFAFTEKMEDSIPKINKIIAMLRFSKFVKSKIMERKYDFLVLLTTIPAILLGYYIKKAYSGKYLVDVRDYTYEGFYIYRHILKGIFNKADMRVISSPAFKNFLPLEEYIICHNLSMPKDSDRNIRAKKPRNKSVLNISYIGAIAYFIEATKLLDAIANDSRFIFSFYGSGVDDQALKNYCLANGINNVYFHGLYQPSEKEAFYAETDLVYNAYGNDALLLRYSLSNKLYDAAWYRIPILVSPGTAMSETAGYMGFELDYRKAKIAVDLYDWYNELDWERFNITADTLIAKAFDDNKKFERKLLSTLKIEEKS